MDFNLTTLDITNLVMAMGEERAVADQKLNDFLKENNLSAQRYFIFDFVIKQGGQIKILYLSYAAIKEEIKGKNGIQTLKLKNNNFLHFAVNKSDYNDFLLGDDFKKVSQYMKDNNLHNDVSALYGLTEIVGDEYNFYVPYKK
jgi:hypothetical protein